VKLLNGENINVEKDIKPNHIIFSNISNFYFTKSHVDSLEKLIIKHKPDLVIIDNIARCLKGSERDEKDVSLILGLLKPLIEKYRVSFVIIHHTRKGNVKRLDDIRGSGDFGGQSDNVFILKQISKKDKVKKFIMIHFKARYGLEIDAINFTVDSVDDELYVKYVGTAKENIEKSTIDLIEPNLMVWIMENTTKKWKTKDIVEAMEKEGFKSTNIKKTIKKLTDDEVLRHGKYGWYELNE